MRGGVVHAEADEALKLPAFGRAVFRAGGDDNGFCERLASVGELDRVRPARAVDAHRLRRDVDRGAELLRLHERAPGERAAGDAGREAEIVLDLASSSPPGRRRRALRPPSRSRPSEAAYTAAARPAGPAPTTTRSCTCASSISGFMPRKAASVRISGLRSTPRGASTTGTSSTPTPWRHEQLLDARVLVDVEAHVRMVVAREELAQAAACSPSSASRPASPRYAPSRSGPCAAG